jgi:NAD(P)-dependent dehydrogenase (short-subunit alcohol dehydrogenase family)
MKRALVTGAASGIGRASAALLAERGFAVVGADRDERALQELPSGVEGVACDLSSEAGRRIARDAAGELDVLVHAAAIIRLAPLLDVSEDDLRAMLDVNVAMAFLVLQTLAPQVRDGGAIVNVASAAAKLGQATESAVYAATKAALLSLTRSFAAELAPRRVRVNAICPGIIETPMQETVIAAQVAISGQTREAILERRLQAVPLRRLGEPEDCARLIAFLTSDEASYLTGQAINVTGGMVTW